MVLSAPSTDDPPRGRQPRQESSACPCAGPTDAGASSRTKRRPRHRGLEDRGRQARPEGLDGGTAGKGGWGPPERSAALTTRPVPGPVRAAEDRPLVGVPIAPSRCAEAARPNRWVQSSSLAHPLLLISARRFAGAPEKRVRARPEGLDGGTAGRGPSERSAALTNRAGPLPYANGRRPAPYGVPSAASRCAEAARPYPPARSSSHSPPPARPHPTGCRGARGEGKRATSAIRRSRRWTAGKGGRGSSERSAALTTRPIPGPVRAAGDRPPLALVTSAS